MAFTFCILGSGSGGNCTLVRAGRTSILIDAGFSARAIGNRLASVGVRTDQIDAILLTHEHTDHVAGAVAASRRWRRPLICRPAVARRLRLSERKIFGVEAMEMESFDLGDLRVTPFPVPHDAVETVGFVVEGEGVRAACASDLGHPTLEVGRHLTGCQVVALEANHDVELTRSGPYPWSLKQRILGKYGHLSNEDAGSMLASVVGPETTRVILTHLSETNNAPHLALVEVQAALDRRGNSAVALTAAGQVQPGEPITL